MWLLPLDPLPIVCHFIIASALAPKRTVYVLGSKIALFSPTATLPMFVTLTGANDSPNDDRYLLSASQAVCSTAFKKFKLAKKNNPVHTMCFWPNLAPSHLLRLLDREINAAPSIASFALEFDFLLTLFLD